MNVADTPSTPKGKEKCKFHQERAQKIENKTIFKRFKKVFVKICLTIFKNKKSLLNRLKRRKRLFEKLSL